MNIRCVSSVRSVGRRNRQIVAVHLWRKILSYGQRVDKLGAARLSSPRGTAGQARLDAGRIGSGHHGATPWINTTPQFVA